jgi:hypothetical protein
MYSGGSRLSAEKASKLSHLDVLNSELVNQLLKNFESSGVSDFNVDLEWSKYNISEKLEVVFSVDGSLQEIKGSTPPYKELSFVKTALLRLKLSDLEKIDKRDPHPLELKQLMSDSALYHATVFPLKFVHLEGMSVSESVRRVIFESLQDESLKGEPFQTLKWIAYRKWDTTKMESSPKFQCPYVSKDDPSDLHVDDICLPFDRDTMECPYCKKLVYLSDMLGFHLEMDEDSVQGSVASSYMIIHEVLLLFTGVKLLWDSEKRNFLSRCLFLKDGPLSLRSQYSKIVPNIRDFFTYARAQNVIVHMVGQEKTGYFVDHFMEIDRCRKIKKTHPIPHDSYYLLRNDYIKREIQRRPNDKNPYGLRTNYGNKIFVKLKDSHYAVLSIPVGEYRDSDSIEDLIGAEKIFSTLRELLSYSHENAMVPIQLANGVASLSTYPSAKVLQLFSESF